MRHRRGAVGAIFEGPKGKLPILEVYQLGGRCIIFNLMFRLRAVKTEVVENEDANNLSEPRKRERRIITRKNENSEKSNESRKVLQRTPKVKEFEGPDLSSIGVKTPDSKRDRLEAVPRLSFHESQLKPFITYQPLWKAREGSEANSESARELQKAEPRTERDSQLKNDHFLKKI